MENPYYLDEENGWQPDVEDIKSKINDKTKAIIIINPNNPTGSIANYDTLKELVDIAAENDLVIFADEIYDKLLFDDNKLVSISSINSDASVITFGGLSKNYMVPGFRIGWGVVSGQKEILSDYTRCTLYVQNMLLISYKEHLILRLSLHLVWLPCNNK